MTKKSDKKAAYQRRDRRKSYRKGRDEQLIALIRELVGTARLERRHELHYRGRPLDSILYTHYSGLLNDRLANTAFNISEWPVLLEETKAEIMSLSFEQRRCVRFTVKIHPELHDRWVSSKRDIKAEIRDALTKELRGLGIEHMPYLFVTEGHCKYRSKIDVHIHGMAVSSNSREDALLHKALGRATGNGTKGRPPVSHAVQVTDYDPTKGWIGYITKNLPRKDDRLGEKRFAFSRKATEMGRRLYNALLGRNPAPVAVPLAAAATAAPLTTLAGLDRRGAIRSIHDRGKCQVAMRPARYREQERWAALSPGSRSAGKGKS